MRDSRRFLLGLLIVCAGLSMANQVPAQTNCLPVPAGLVGWWAGEGNAIDSTGTNNGVLQGDVTFVPGEVGQAFSFDGTTANVEVPASTSLNVGQGGGLTIEAWIEPADLSASRPIAEWNSGAGSEPYGVHFWTSEQLPYGNGPGCLYADLIDAEGGYHYFASPGSLLTTNAFQHVALTYDQASGAAAIYLNGSVVAQTGVGSFTPQTSSALYLGYRPAGPASGTRFVGAMDEVSLYSRALSAAEIQAIYAAGSAGKCALAPVIVVQPQSQSIVLGQTASLSVEAGGSPPLSYQWFFITNSIAGASGSSLVLTNVQLTNAGEYSVIVSNAAGTATSSNAVLTILPALPCDAPPPGLVSWWRGEGDASDFAGENNGVLQGDVSFVPGEVGQAFSFDGTTADVEVPASASLNVGSGPGLTVEAWVKPAGLSAGGPLVEWNSGSGPEPFGVHFWASQPLPYGGGPGCLYADVIDSGGGYHYFTSPGGLLTTQAFQHVALSYNKANGAAVIYLNGTNVAQASLGSFTPQTAYPLYLGVRPAGAGAARFAGEMDEVGLYARALSAAEIQAIYAAGSSGKCAEAIAPYVLTQPQSQTAEAGATVSFSATVAGSLPLGYQWLLNSNAVAGATASSLVLTNVQLANAGAYSIIVSNAAGVVSSSNAVLTVKLPPALVQAGTVGGLGAHAVTVPIFLVANGNENALTFTLDFNPALLTYTSIVPGSGSPGGAIVPNGTNAGSGLVGVELGLPSGVTFAPGTQEVADVTFSLSIVTSNSTATVGFGSQVLKTVVVDAYGNPLPANFVGGTVSIAKTAVAGDVYPRPNGDEQVTVSDWVQEGRYVAGLDSPTNASEFERADCAPRDTGGDGQITIIDWVQVGRYAAGLDPLTPAGTNTGGLADLAGTGRAGLRNSSFQPLKAYDQFPRQLQLKNAVILQAQSGTVSVNLQALGDENALGFSLSFDPSVLTYTSASAGSGVNGAVFNVNAKQAASGRLGIALALGAGSSLPSGNLEVATIKFSTPASASGSYPVAVVNQPVVCQISDAKAQALTNITYVNGAVVVSQPPSLSASLSGQSIQLSWPVWASNFILEQAAGPLASSMSWSNVATNTITTSATANTATLPVGNAGMFYRLIQQ